MHPVNKPKKELLEQFILYENINFLDELHVAEILPLADMLITDYSSIYFDYLLTNKPIIFTPFDYEKYITKDRELYYDYNEVTPGPKCNDWNEVLEWIKKFEENSNLFQEKRYKIKNKFHKYQDNKRCGKVINAIYNIKN